MREAGYTGLIIGLSGEDIFIIPYDHVIITLLSRCEVEPEEVLNSKKECSDDDMYSDARVLKSNIFIFMLDDIT